MNAPDHDTVDSCGTSEFAPKHTHTAQPRVKMGVSTTEMLGKG